VQQSLLPADPFDEHAAFEDMTAKAAAVEHLQKLYEEKKQQAADVKKQLEAAETLYQQIGIEYRRKERAWREQQEREAAAQRAYLEKLEADAAAKAQGQLPIGEADQVVSNPPSEADSVRQSAEPTPVAPLGGAVGSISDSLPKCPCGNTLATNEEAARKTCDECDRLTDEENARATDAAEMQLPPGV
jgi:hypothetical protein